MKSFKEYLSENAAAALDFAIKAHKGQFRSDGTPYVKHPERVAKFVEQFKQSKNMNALIAAALLHDTVEDTNTTHEDLEKLFGGLIASLVKELTSDKREIERIGKTEYLSRKLANMSSWALAIKLADRLDNVQDIATAKTPAWRRKHRAETEAILSRLERDRELTGSHKRIIKAIRKKLEEVE